MTLDAGTTSADSGELPRTDPLTAGASSPEEKETGFGEEMRNLRKHTMVYGAGIVLSKLASFVMLPVYTHYLSPADYGVLELLSMTIEIIGTISGMGLLAGIYKLYNDGRTEVDRRRLLSTALLASSGIALGTCLLGLLFSPLLTQLIIGGDGPALYFRLFFLIYLFQTVSAVPSQMLRLLERSGTWVAINVGKLVLQLSLNIAFVVGLGLGVRGVLLGNLIAAAVVSLGLVLWTLRHTGIHFSREALRALGRYGNPMLVWSLSNFLLVFSDRFFLKHYADASAVGIYSLAYKFAFMLSAFAFAPFNYVWDPQRFAIAKRADAPHIFSRVFVYLNVALVSMALLIAVYIRDILAVMAAPEFLPAYRFVPVLLAAQVVFHWVTFCNVGVLVTGKTRPMAAIGVLGAMATLALNFALIPFLGILGATVATLLAYAVRFALIYNRAQRSYPIPYDWSAIGRLGAIYALAVLARFALPHAWFVASLAESTVIALLALGAVYAFVLKDEERAYVRRVLGRSRAVLALRGA